MNTHRFVIQKDKINHQELLDLVSNDETQTSWFASYVNYYIFYTDNAELATFLKIRA